MVWPAGQPPCEAKNLRTVHLLNVVQQKSVGAHSRQKVRGSIVWVSSVTTSIAVHGASMPGQIKSWQSVAVSLRAMYSSKYAVGFFFFGW